MKEKLERDDSEAAKAAEVLSKVTISSFMMDEPKSEKSEQDQEVWKAGEILASLDVSQLEKPKKSTWKQKVQDEYQHLYKLMRRPQKLNVKLPPIPESYSTGTTYQEDIAEIMTEAYCSRIEAEDAYKASGYSVPKAIQTFYHSTK